ncbi:hypothetical protein ACFSS8_07105 [Paracoccus kondratievae]
MSESVHPANAKADMRTAAALFVFALLVVVLSVVALVIWGCPR